MGLDVQNAQLLAETSQLCVNTSLSLPACIQPISASKPWANISSTSSDSDGADWTNVTPMATKHSRALLNDHVYVVGGFDGTAHLSSVEAYNICTDSWTTVTSMTPLPAVMWEQQS